MSLGHPAVSLSQPIAIIGMGCMFPKAPDLAAFWRLLRRGDDAIGPTPPSHWSIADYVDADPKRPDHTYCGRGGFLSPTAFDPTEFGIPPAILEATDTSQLLGLVVAKAALEDAGYGEGGPRSFNRERVSVILGVTGLQELALPLGARLGHPIWRRALAEAGVPDEQASDAMARMSDAYVAWQENSFPGLLGNVVAGRIANRLNLRGTNCVVDAACASSLAAAHLAMMELATGRCDLALTGGVDALNDIFMYMCFSKTPALSPTGDARPFSDDADGTVLGEGVGMLVLKRLADAERDGDRVYAVIRGIGTSSDGRSQSIYAPHAAGQARALRDAYRIAGVSPDEVELIEAHGTGTTVGDAVEFEALSSVFGEAAGEAADGAGDGGPWCAIGSVKSQIGHTKAAAGAAGLIKAALAIYCRSQPPTIKVRRPNPRLNIDTSPFFINAGLRPWAARGGRPRRAAVSSFGFGGSNYHAVLEASPASLAEPAWDGSVQVVALSSETPGGLGAQLEEWSRHVCGGRSSPGWVAHLAARSRKTFSHAHAHRLTMIIEPDDNVAAQLGEAGALLKRETSAGQTVPQERHAKVFYGTGRPAGKLAFVFPGQASQYVNMACELACTFPEMVAALEQAEAAGDEGEARLSALIYPPAAFDEAARAAAARALSRTEHAQPALGVVCHGMARVLERFGVTPDLLAGHSFGELAALCEAGRFDAAALHRLARLRGRLMGSGDGGAGAMLAVQAPLDEIAAMVERERPGVVLANRNSPSQAVLSGPREAVARAAAACKSRGWTATPLDVSGAFHSELMAHAAGPFRQALESVEFAPGRVPVFAGATGRVYPAGPAARAILAEQLTTPVDFVSVVNGLHEAGARVFVEVGPKRVLCGLIAATLADRPHETLAIDAGAGQAGGGLVDLARVLARLAAQGRHVDLSRWERDVPEPRTPRMIVPLVGANYRAPRAAGSPAVTAEPRTVAQAPAIEPASPPVAAQLSLPSEAVRVPPEQSMSSSSSFTELPSPLPLPSPSSPPSSQAEAASPSNLAAQPGVGAGPDASNLLLQGLQAMQALQQQTAAAHQRFLEAQEQAHRAMVRLLESRGAAAHVESVGPVPAALVEERVVSEPATRRGESREVERVDAGSSGRRTGATAPAAGDAGMEGVVLDVVCEKTGYPREMIELDMDIEADLGIDSIKRVEIVAAIEERLPGFGGIKPEHMGAIRTLREILAFVEGSLSPAAGSPAPVREATAPRVARASCAPASAAVSSAASVAGPPEGFADVLLDVVAQLTGYPRDMLDLGMDLEADLGIDSIKRVEILAAVEAKLPQLPPIQPEYMGSLRTLSQIAETFTANGGPIEPARAAARAAMPSCGAACAMPPPAMPTAAGMAAACRSDEAGHDVQAVRRRVLVARRAAEPGRGGRLLADGATVWVTREGGELAEQLAARLGAEGLDARLVSISDGEASGSVQGERPSADATFPAGLVIVLPDRSSGDSLWSPETEGLTCAAFGLVRRASSSLQTAGEEGGAVIACVTRMDGRLGLTGGDFDAAQAGLAGIVKTAAQEWPGVVGRAIDVSRSWSGEAAVAAVADAILGGGSGAVEIGLSPEGRIELALEDRPGEAASPEATGGAGGRVRPSLHAGDVVVVSGGARGVTAAAAAALAEAVQPVLVLLGRSPAPADEPAWLHGAQDAAAVQRAVLEHEFAGMRPSPRELRAACERHLANREIRRAMDRMAAAGSRVRYERVDVRDASATRAVLKRVREELGPIRGLIHAAGVLEDRRIEDKTDEQFTRVYETKVRGLSSLLAAVDEAELRQVVLFSSVAGRFGNAGQADYAAANEVLNKAAQRLARRLPQAGVCAINWGPWDGGMVNEGLRREFARRGVMLISQEAGAATMVRECRLPPGDGRRDVEIVIGDGLEPAPRGQAGAGSVAITTPAAGAAMADLRPAFDRRIDIDSHPFLRSHLLNGQPVLPAAVSLEWLGQAAVHANPGLALCGLDEFRILRGVVLDTGERTLQWLTGPPTRRGGEFFVAVEMRSSGRGEREVVHARAVAVLGTSRPSSPIEAQAYVSAAAAGGTGGGAASSGIAELSERRFLLSVDSAYSEVLFHGEHFRAIEEIRGISSRGLVARVRTAPTAREWMAQPIRGEWLTDPLAIDAAFQLAILWCHQELGALSLPAGLAAYRQYRPRFPREGVMVSMRVREAARNRVTADFEFTDAAGEVVAQVAGYECTVDPGLRAAFRKQSSIGLAV